MNILANKNSSHIVQKLYYCPANMFYHGA